jgi:hypothetical protein
MKLLPCNHCKGSNYAIGPPTEEFPNGEPLVMGGMPSDRLIYRCHRCNNAMELSVTQFNALRSVPEDRVPLKLKSLGFRWDAS